MASGVLTYNPYGLMVIYEFYWGIDLFWYRRGGSMKRHLPFVAVVTFLCACLIPLYIPFHALCSGPEISETILRENLLPAQQGDPQAQLFVGYLYETGQGVTRNYVTAAQWYHKAAEQGNTIAQSQLGNMYRLGKGVPQNYILAYMWFDLAAKGGIANAKDMRRMVASKMSPAEIAEAKQLIREWKPKR